jgi:hypothetical protein
VFIALGLAWQMASGNDPALGANAQSVHEKRRILQTTVVHRIAGPDATTGGTASAAGASAAQPSAPVVSSPAPVTSSAS